MKKHLWWVQSVMKIWVLYFIKHKNDMHASAALQKLYRLFELSKFRFQGHNYNLFEGLFKIG